MLEQGPEMVTGRGLVAKEEGVAALEKPNAARCMCYRRRGWPGCHSIGKRGPVASQQLR